MLTSIGVHQAMESSSASAFVSASGQLADRKRAKFTLPLGSMLQAADRPKTSAEQPKTSDGLLLSDIWCAGRLKPGGPGAPSGAA